MPRAPEAGATFGFRLTMPRRGVRSAAEDSPSDQRVSRDKIEPEHSPIDAPARLRKHPAPPGQLEAPPHRISSAGSYHERIASTMHALQQRAEERIN
jgi:hypothetical protein